jgi:hypothetical protein
MLKAVQAAQQKRKRDQVKIHTMESLRGNAGLTAAAICTKRENMAEGVCQAVHRQRGIGTGAGGQSRQACF